MSIRPRILISLACLMLPAAVWAQSLQANLAFPMDALERRLSEDAFEILSARPSRGLEKEMGLRAEVRFDDGVEMRLKVRPAGIGGSEFNNEPRYELAAYRIQSLFLDPADYVVPPTALRMMPRDELRQHTSKAKSTFRLAKYTLVVVQYWLLDIDRPQDALDLARFAADEDYARHIGNLNVLTYVIRHMDSNLGNFLVSTVPGDPHVWSVDNGVAFESEEGSRGKDWMEIRVPRLPREAIERLRGVSEATLQAHLGVLGQWEKVDRRLEPRPLGRNLSIGRGVRVRGRVVQLGLTRREIHRIYERIETLLKRVDTGEIGLF